ncbi:hypothetical protein MOQ_003479 [Trypanosoma cruzi marinkellei]|uniref:Uncharacterized protein n=1 Tax=Trypanosoma cruzi marinkellei TaxID=85056 RepID=K2MBX0_TRYCR|nr:hypothetical protein MOQ_003479 [Trypanosoma cruzi marinkellei]
MLMETLEREVEALSAEVTRLRFMVYHMKDAVCSSAPPLAAAASSVNRRRGGGAAAETTDSAVNLKANGSTCGVSPSLGVVLQDLTQTVAQLLAASNEVRMASSALRKGREEKNNERPRRRQGSRARKKTKKHRRHRRSSSTSSSASPALSSSLSSSTHRASKKKRRSHRHADKKKDGNDLRRQEENTEDGHNDLTLIKPRKSTSQEKELHASNAVAQCQLQKEEEDQEFNYSKDEGNKRRSSLQSSQGEDDRLTRKTPAELESVERSRPPSLGASYGMLASVSVKSASAGEPRTSIRGENQSSSAVAIPVPPRKMDGQREEDGETPPSSSADGYSFLTHGTLSLGRIAPEKTKNASSTTTEITKTVIHEEKSKGKGNMQFKPLHMFRTPPTQRRTLLDRFRGGSDESSTSDERESTPASLQLAGEGTTSHSMSLHNAVNNAVGFASAENVSRNSFAFGAVRSNTPDSFGGYGAGMMEEYGFALNESFHASQSAENINSRGHDEPSAILTRTNARYHLRDGNSTN